MKRFMTYAKNHKGVTLVLMALMLALLLVFASLAIDISYMYFTKNQLQVAADAAALAGAALLHSVSSSTDYLIQSAARNAAIEFAYKNTATGQPVQLVTNNSNTLSVSNDITVGNWDSTNNPPYTPGGTLGGIPINAIEVQPKKASGLSGSRGPVRLFLGSIFKALKFLGIDADWTFMSTSANAIASFTPLQRGPFPLCYKNCGLATPLVATGENLTPGIRFILKKKKGTPNIGWTTFLDGNTSKSNIEDYLRGIKTPPEICHQCVHTTEGVVGPTPCTIREMIRLRGRNHVVNGVTIFGWRVMIPVLEETPCPPGKKIGCYVDPEEPGDPGLQPGDPYKVSHFSEVIITDGAPQGTCPKDPGPLAPGESGVVILGTGPSGTSGTSTINCLPCDDPYWDTLVEQIKLVK